MTDIKIEFGNVMCRLYGVTDENILYDIANKLSYNTGGFGEPKKLNVLFSLKTCMTYTGLIPHMLKILKKYGIVPKLVDKRTKPMSKNYYSLKNITPRDYQQNVLDNAMPRMIVQACTSAGKTLIMAGLIAKYNVKNVLVIAPKASLAVQNRDEIAKFLGTEVGLLVGGTNDVKNITVATPQMALKSSILNNVEFILCDEAHNIPANTICEVFKSARNAYYRVGLSATPWRDGEEDILLEAMINIRNPKTNINASSLIKKGFLTPCEFHFIKQESYCGWQGDYNSTYNKAIVNNTERNNKILNIVKDSIRTDKGSILVLFSQVNHGQKLYDMISKNVVNNRHKVEYNNNIHYVNTVEIIDGSTDMERREIILKGAREEKVKILLGSTIADEGLSCSPLKVLILAGSGKSSTRAFQRVGRVLRKWKNRNRAYVYDFIDSNDTFYKHFKLREALYKTESEWKKNFHY